MKLVVIESPYAGDVDRNTAYARACMADSLARGEAPFASHLLYTQHGILDDTIPDERAKGICAGFAWASEGLADGRALRVVYCDLGMTPGMIEGIEESDNRGVCCAYRYLGAPWSDFPATPKEDPTNG